VSLNHIAPQSVAENDDPEQVALDKPGESKHLARGTDTSGFRGLRRPDRGLVSAEFKLFFSFGRTPPLSTHIGRAMALCSCQLARFLSPPLLPGPHSHKDRARIIDLLSTRYTDEKQDMDEQGVPLPPPGLIRGKLLSSPRPLPSDWHDCTGPHLILDPRKRREAMRGIFHQSRGSTPELAWMAANGIDSATILSNLPYIHAAYCASPHAREIDNYPRMVASHVTEWTALSNAVGELHENLKLSERDLSSPPRDRILHVEPCWRFLKDPASQSQVAYAMHKFGCSDARLRALAEGQQTRPSIIRSNNWENYLRVLPAPVSRAVRIHRLMSIMPPCEFMLRYSLPQAMLLQMIAPTFQIDAADPFL
jgi:hypothetical protein